MLEECGKVWNFKLNKPLDVINRTYWILLVGARKTRMLRKMRTVEGPAHEFWKGTRTLPETHLEVIHIAFRQRMATSMLNSKVMG